ncbi:MAG: undecaprenyl-diphosphate phosphatase [Alphaproteobacteria bacterium]|nr:undecaprenyl-diphosphate phosphatase [Alphaproteobacteria bacterium]
MPDLITILKAALMGVVEGFTEFLPISSTGHLILLGEGIGFQGPSGYMFEVVIQLGAILAVVIAFFPRLWHVTLTLHRDAASRHFVWAVLLGFLPAAVVGALVHDFIKAALFNPLVVAWALLLGGVAILVIERNMYRVKTQAFDRMPLKTAFLIGCAQCLAMVPGVSRSGATIMGALLLGVERRVAAEFSFFLAIPTMMGATVYDFYKNRDAMAEGDTTLLVIGFIAAFFAAWPIAKGFIAFVGRYGFAPFAWYRIAIGGLLLAVLLT